jgi:hypothetical protein
MTNREIGIQAARNSAAHANFYKLLHPFLLPSGGMSFLWAALTPAFSSWSSARDPVRQPVCDGIDCDPIREAAGRSHAPVRFIGLEFRRPILCFRLGAEPDA